MNATAIRTTDVAATARANLVKANRVRTSRAGAKADLRSGRLPLADALAEPPEALSRLALWELLRLAPRLGTERAVRINRQAVDAGINLALPLGRASHATRRWLSDTLAEQPAGRRHGGSTPATTPAAAAPPPRLVVVHEDPRAEQLARAITAHRVAVRGPSPADAFGTADDALYERCTRIMATVDKPAENRPGRAA